MAFPQHIWNQLKNLTADDLVRALLRDGWEKDPASKGAIHGYLKKDQTGKTVNRVTIHYHPQKTYGAKLLKSLLDDIGWEEDDFTRLQLIK